MNIVILDSVTANPGDLSWDFLKKYGTLTVYDRSPVDTIYERAKDADIVIMLSRPIQEENSEETAGNIVECILAKNRAGECGIINLA